MGIKLVYGCDWVGLYNEDGILVAENHNLDAEDALAALKIDHEILEVDEDWLDERGSMPDHFSEVKLDG